MTQSGGVDGHADSYQPVMMEPPGVHFDSNYSVLSAMDTQSSGMLQQPNYDAHVCIHSINISFWLFFARIHLFSPLFFPLRLDTPERALRLSLSRSTDLLVPLFVCRSYQIDYSTQHREKEPSRESNRDQEYIYIFLKCVS